MRGPAFKAALTLAVVTCCLGCGRGQKAGTVPVSGVVNYQGQPVADAQVTFSPKDGAGVPAYASTDSAGRFALGLEGKREGAIPGEYNVAVFKAALDGPAMSDEEIEKYRQTHDGNMPNTNMKYEVPAKYGNPRSSGLTANITQQGPNDIKLDLK